MIILHHLENSRSQRILWLLEELRLPYKIKRYERDAKTMLAPDSLRAVHPLGKSPVISDGDVVVAESGAIIEYLVEKYGQGELIPAANTPERRQYTYWLHYAEGSAMPPLLMSLVFRKLPQGAPLLLRPLVGAIAGKVMDVFIKPQLKNHFDFIESELGKSEWFAGPQFSAADIQMSFPVEAAAARGGLHEKSSPGIFAFLKRIHARPAYQRAMEKGGPFEILG